MCIVLELMALSAESERLLMHAACADSYHDFSHPPKGFGNSFNPIRTETAGKPGLYDVCIGLPSTKATQSIPLSRISGNQYNPDMLHKENQMLQELFKGQTIGEGPFESKYTVPNPIEEDKKFVKNLCKAIAASRIDAARNQEHKASCSFDTLLGKESYTLKLLSDSTGEVNINEIQSLQENKKKGRDARPSKIKVSDLFRFFGSNEVNLVFDACSMNITSLFKNALPGGDQVMNVNWLINREFLNDPATKPMADDPKVALVAPNQMKFRFLVEADPNTIAYTRYEGKADSGVLMRDKFFSLLDFKLGPLQIRAPGAHPNTRLEVFQDGNKSIYISDSPNIHNQIGECCSSIWSAITGTSNNHLITAAHYQRKRSGDWFQALSCLDTGRLYYDRDGADKSPMPLKNKNITLVTHDRILLWYGLMQGLDVLFAGGKGIEEVEGGEEDETDEEAESSGSSAGGPKLYLILFSNNKRTQTKEQIDAANLRTAEELLPKIAQLKADIATFNTNLREIEVERNNSIDVKFSEITEVVDKDGKATKGKPLKIVDLIKEFVRYSALDYSEVNISNFDRVSGDFIRLKDSTNKAEYEKKISAALLFISTFTSLRLRMDTLSNKDSIKTSDNFSRDSAIFKDALFPSSLMEPFDYEIRSRAPGGAERKAAVQKTVTQLAMMLSSTLSIDNLRRLRRFIDGASWNEGAKRYDPKEADFICINDIIAKNDKDPKASHLNIIATSIMTRLLDVALSTPAEAVMKVAVEAIVQNSVYADRITAATPEAAAAAVQGVTEPAMPAFSKEKFDDKVAAAGGKVENLKTVELDAGEKAATVAEVKNQAKNQEYSRKMAIADAAKLAYTNALASLEENRRKFNIADLRKIQKKGISQRSANNSRKLGELVELRDEIIRLEAEAVAKDDEYKKAIDEAEAIKPFIFQVPQAPPVRSIRMRISNFFNIGPTLRSWANKALRFFNQLNLEGGAKNLKGGARGDKEFWAFMLFLSYMNELVSTINGFDDRRNLDYKYFQGLSALVMSYLKEAVQTGNVIAIAQFLYFDLPNGNWGDRDDFSRFVAYAGRTISLRAVDQMVGEIPTIDKRSVNLKISNSVSVAYDSNIRLLGSYKRFEDRKLQIVKKLGNYVSSLATKYFPKVVEPEQNLNTRAIVNVPRVTLPPLPNRLPGINLQNTRVLVAPVSGGKKTKRANKAKNTKKKTVKGGRKTTRKNRF